ncbi:MAG: hypothetical protein KAY50_00580 [Chitinophagaceae bacterium]|nr:hypothetical protein [Chitinophagaceae bacterium]
MKAKAQQEGYIKALKFIIGYILFWLLIVLVAKGQIPQYKDSCYDSAYKVLKTVTTTMLVDTTVKKCVQVPIPAAANYASHYLNGISGWFYTAQGQDAYIAWLKSNGEGKAEPYGIDGIIGSTSNYKWIARWNKQCAINGILSVYVWSNASNVTGEFDKFQKAQTDPQCKFVILKNEGEPYNNTISYEAWWKFGRIVLNYARANGLKTEVYLGWHTQQSYDSIVVLYDAISIHVYISSTRMTQPASMYGYTNTRLGMISASMEKMYPGQPTKKMTNDVLTSSEPSFGQQYYINNHGDFRAPLATYKSGFASGASTLIKKRIEIRSNVTFVSATSKVAKPIPGLPASAMRMKPEVHMRKMVSADPDTRKVTVEEKIDWNLYKQTKDLN